MVLSLLSSEVVLVLGMHRSGTSLFMRMCNLLGAELADDLIPPREDNAKGFFEHGEVVAINERIFELFGLNSQDVVPFPEHWWEHKGVAPLREELKACLLRTYNGIKLWGIKDPRIGKLLPLWLPLLKELGVTPHIFIPFRSPFEVAASLKKREQLSMERGLLLWLQYNLAIEYHTREYARVFIHYPDMISHTPQMIEKMVGAVPTLGKQGREEAEKAIAAFIDPGLRHHNAKSAQGVGMPSLIEKLYAHMITLSQGGSCDGVVFDDARRIADMFTVPFQETVAALDPSLHAWRDMVDVQGKERAALKEKIAVLEQQLLQTQKSQPLARLKRLMGA